MTFKALYLMSSVVDRHEVQLVPADEANRYLVWLLTALGLEPY